VDEQLGLGGERGLVRERGMADLVERVRGVGDQLADRDLLVGVEGVDDQRHQLVDLGWWLLRRFFRWWWWFGGEKKECEMEERKKRGGRGG